MFDVCILKSALSWGGNGKDEIFNGCSDFSTLEKRAGKNNALWLYFVFWNLLVIISSVGDAKDQISNGCSEFSTLEKRAGKNNA